MKGQCIICRKENVELTDEHIIPDSIGGLIHSYRVCKVCNSELGQHVDNLLVNNFLVKFHRFLHKIPGKSGFIPNPLTAKSADGSDGHKYRLEEENGQIIPKLIPQKIEEKNGVIEIVSDEYGEKDVQKSVEKFCERNGFVLRETTKVKIPPPKDLHFNIQSTLNIDDFKLPFLKIGYEFAIEHIKDYFNDSYAVEVSKSLCNYDLSKMTINPFRSSCLNKNLNNILDNFIDNSKNNKHVILLDPTPKGLVCLISLFGQLSMLLFLSENDYTSCSDAITCVNELGKNPIEMTLTDVVARIQQIKCINFFNSSGKQISAPFAMDKNYEPVIFVNKEKPEPLSSIINSLNQSELAPLKEVYEYNLPKSSYVLFQNLGMIEISKVQLLYELHKL